jgi:amidase
MSRIMLTRRSLLVGAAGAGALAALHACGSASSEAIPDASPDALPPVAPFELDEMSLAGMREALQSGAYTSVRLVELYLGRITAVDGRTNSILHLSPDSTRDAEALDAERAGGHVRGPLHGIPIVVKANIDTADRMPTTAGSVALAGHLAGRDAAVIERLRAAGCVLLAKTNLSEWANFRGFKSSSGWSAEGGQTRNPYALSHSPSGSSSG